MGVMQIVEDDLETAAAIPVPLAQRGKAVKRWHIDHHISCSSLMQLPVFPAFVPEVC